MLCERKHQCYHHTLRFERKIIIIMRKEKKTSSYLAIGRIGECIDIEEMPLLFQDIRLRLPFPHEELPQLARTKGQPLPSRVDGHLENEIKTRLFIEKHIRNGKYVLLK